MVAKTKVRLVMKMVMVVEVVVMVVVGCLSPAAVHAQLFFRGGCPSTPIIRDFSWEKYLGTWYEQERYFVLYQKELGRCWSQTYIKDVVGHITVEQKFRYAVNNAPAPLVRFNVIQKRPVKEPNRFTYAYPRNPSIQRDIEVLGTNYGNWTLEYSCINLPPFGHYKKVWILTRSQHPDPAVITKAKEVLISLGINVDFLSALETFCFL